MSAANWILLALVIFVLLVCGYRAVMWMFGEISGWRKLEPDFACDASAPVWNCNGQTLRVNSVRFRSCVNAGIAADALYLRVKTVFGFKPLRIPWNSMTLFQPDKVYGRPAMRFSVDGSVIVVESALYTQMYPYLVKSRNMLARGQAQG